jgi:2-haloacid dehalogenase
VRAVAFDLFTSFDPRTIDRRVAAALPDAAAFAATWKSRLFEYSWLRAAAGRYVPFDRLVLDAFEYTARSLGVAVSPAVRDELVRAFTMLDLWPDAAEALRHMRARGLRLATLANFSPAMISSLLEHAGLTGELEHQISTDASHTYKPDPRAYALAEQALALPREQIVFAAFGNWDAAGAAWFGFPVFWVNRLGATPEQLGPTSIESGPDLVALDTWMSHRSSG